MLTSIHATDWGGKSFLRFLLDLAHSASVPISVHLDHATTDHDIETALSLAEAGVAFDSIMVDASHADTDEENLAVVRAAIRGTRDFAHAARSSSAVDIPPARRPLVSRSRSSWVAWRAEKLAFASSRMPSLPRRTRPSCSCARAGQLCWRHRSATCTADTSTRQSLILSCESSVC